MKDGDRVKVVLFAAACFFDDSGTYHWFPADAVKEIPSPSEFFSTTDPDAPVDTEKIRARHIMKNATAIGPYCVVCVSLIGDVWPCETIKLCDALDKVHQEMSGLCLDNVERLREIMRSTGGE